jgi:phage major head subunit gpT-like protein
MGALTPTLLLGLEDRMNIEIEREYARLTQNLWWQDVAKTRTSTGRKELITWLLSTAQIRDLGASAGNLSFDDLVATYTEVENKFAGAGLKLTKAQLEDTDGGGLDLAAQWSSDIGAYMAYWPQKKVADAMKNGHTASLYTGYDGKALFASDHPVNPLNVAAGTYQNIFTGGSSGAYPGACPIDDGVTVDVALANLAKIVSYIASIKMPNGEDPRFLRVKKLIVGPRMFPRAVQLTSAKTIAQAASSGGGGADVEMLIKSLGFAQPIQADELAGYESDTTFFIVAEQAASSKLGPIIYQEREAFHMDAYGPMNQAELGRKQEFEWHVHGRNAVAAGHPYLIFKCKAA